MDVNDGAGEGFSKFFDGYSNAAEQWNKFCAQNIARTPFTEQLTFKLLSVYLFLELPTKELTRAFPQDESGRPVFPNDLDIETETLANIRVLVKTYLEDLWRESTSHYWK